MSAGLKFNYGDHQFAPGDGVADIQQSGGRNVIEDLHTVAATHSRIGTT
jgi:hypothetical protein